MGTAIYKNADNYNPIMFYFFKTIKKSHAICFWPQASIYFYLIRFYLSEIQLTTINHNYTINLLQFFLTLELNCYARLDNNIFPL